MYVDNSGRMRKSRQQEMDERMCRPGYRWNETLGRCLGGYAGGEIDKGPKDPTKPPAPPEQPGETPTGAIKQESMKRAAAKSVK